MGFNKEVPSWTNPGTEPSENLKATGFVGGYKPPASVFNWFWHLVSECLNEIHEMTPDTIGAVPKTRKINGKPLSSDFSLVPSDIGAIPTIKAISDNADLNNYTTPGFYYCIADAKVKEYTNCPTNYAFYLEVGKHAGTYQRLVEYGNQVAKTYFRNLYAGSWGEWQRLYSTCDNPTADAVGAIPETVEVLSTTSITNAAVSQAAGTVKNYCLSGDSYTGNDLPGEAFKFGNASVFKRYNMATIVLWGAPNVNQIATRYYNASTWSDWVLHAPQSYVDSEVSKLKAETDIGSFGTTITDLDIPFGLSKYSVFFHSFSSAASNAPVVSSGFVMTYVHSTSVGVQFSFHLNGKVYVRRKTDSSTIGEWTEVTHDLLESANHAGCKYRVMDGVVEWVNPPMGPNTEYRTTERFLTKPVYTKLANFASTGTSREHQYSQEDVTPIRFSAYRVSNGIASTLPVHTDAEDYRFVEVYNNTIDYVTTAEETVTLYVQVWYIKNG